ncbi:DNA polymerase/3'-5' exonuclease PolX [Streptomyces sp. WAC05374]|uniref:DNA polymerase/3'-5' exonuclease PolX n=1 Tax=Streptomyces sp. WAC05374 TaxID=2487420 RepID=UPI000F85E60E|nr:DNA polymerase/3'-5' exonuclease PolX [Streptomyces sp. WAC05374]RST18957.1 DNA polymerase/3'-5' exonuclease PolX [Streptomyces sp. WAC05374]TDF50642.1 DNA polymerase/3'-5' exonuclease PolX [Streptomyces sp. WAC05374]TDF56932.1 DNA polymerase/3'-5' exonuclease PolX [Streptomyces sp. WAC05374]TDF60895.1 DNA polymerase/3'-5' exonuclease PolX [Streptomyces sp. WAC05374]
MPRANEEVEALLQEYADLIAITGGDAFKARAYEKAARAIGGHHADVSTLDAKGLKDIPNVGRSIAEKVVEYLRSGQVSTIEETRASIPAGVRELITIPTLGPKKAMVLHEELGITSVDQLLEAIHAERLRDLKGFGEKTEANILHGIALMQKAGEGRILISAAMDVAEQIVAELSALPGCARCAYAGSLRRMKETIGDIDVLVAAEQSAPFMEALGALPHTAEVIAHGEKKTSIRTTKGLQVDLRVLPPASWGAGLQYFTGSKAHNIRTREIAVRHKLKLSEYGLFDAESGDMITSETEEDIYARLGLPWIPPTLREDRGEIAAGLKGEVPELVQEEDIRGDLHTHTDLTDGLAPLEDMVAAAAARGYAYCAITDHAPNLYMQRMTDEKMLAQRERVRELDREHRGMRLLHGTELNIDPDGEVDWPPEFLAEFDLCVASVHSHFNQSRQALTRRLVRACENPYVAVIGHPTTRRIGKRPGLDADFDAVFEACAATGTALEINAHPERLDLRDEDVLRAKRYGVKFAVNSDAHSVTHLPYMRYGVGTAQRGWLTKDDVINTWPLTRLRSFLRKGRSRPV